MTTAKLKDWWYQLEPQWRKAFNEAGLNKGAIEDIPILEEATALFQSPAIRFAGPRAPYPNMTFELTNLSGLATLKDVQILVVIHHQIKSLELLKTFRKITGLFVYDNQLTNLKGIEQMSELTSLYCQQNQLKDLEPIKGLKKLQELYVTDNVLTSLSALRDHHGDTIQSFRVLPNNKLPQREIMRVENEVGIRCLTG